MTRRLHDVRILALDPAGRGVGFVLLEGPDYLVDWGFRNARVNRDEKTLSAVAALIDRYVPDVLVVENLNRRSNRPGRIHELIDAFSRMAAGRGIPCRRITRKQRKAQFPDCPSKYEVARTLRERFPELVPICPRKRRPWEPEDSRINVFDALALATVFFSTLPAIETKQAA